PHRWGWEWRSQWQEPSAPVGPNALTESYPVQCPTWVVVLRDSGPGATLPEIAAPSGDRPEQFAGAWEGYGSKSFLNYGRLPGDRFMINWPQNGNDCGEGLHRLVASPTARQEFEQEARWHAQSFARFIQQRLGRRYGLTEDTFPQVTNSMGGGAFALHPYYRESRRLVGLTTLCEQGILPQGQVAPLPINDWGEMEAIALGNYPNDHHYPAPASAALTLTPKSLRWGGRCTGTPFTIPYRSLVPAAVDGLLVCEKNISVSHIANGATRLQPVVLGIGQAAGMAAALCIEQNCQPRQLDVRSLQDALLTDALAPAAVVPLFNLPPHHPDWLYWQRYYRGHADAYPSSGWGPEVRPFPEAFSQFFDPSLSPKSPGLTELEGIFCRVAEQTYELVVEAPEFLAQQTLSLVTLHGEGDRLLRHLPSPQRIRVWGWLNRSGNWLRVERLQPLCELDTGL
ncbi:MAG: FAD-dependent oxidoreductase, partial [Elainellaceae cyanobacterium]